MRRNNVIVTALLLITIGCTKKVIPVISERKTDPPPPVKAVIKTEPDLAQGKTTFMNRCSRCHDLPKPEQYTAIRWKGILSYMIPRARLTDEQGVHVTAYLEANSQK